MCSTEIFFSGGWCATERKISYDFLFASSTFRYETKNRNSIRNSYWTYWVPRIPRLRLDPTFETYLRAPAAGDRDHLGRRESPAAADRVPGYLIVHRPVAGLDVVGLAMPTYLQGEFKYYLGKFGFTKITCDRKPSCLPGLLGTVVTEWYCVAGVLASLLSCVYVGPLGDLDGLNWLYWYPSVTGYNGRIFTFNKETISPVFIHSFASTPSERQQNVSTRILPDVQYSTPVVQVSAKYLPVFAFYLEPLTTHFAVQASRRLSAIAWSRSLDTRFEYWPVSVLEVRRSRPLRDAASCDVWGTLRRALNVFAANNPNPVVRMSAQLPPRSAPRHRREEIWTPNTIDR